MVFFSALLLIGRSPAAAQQTYFWATYALTGYGSIDMGYYCDDGALSVAVHGETKGSLSVSLGDVSSAPTSFDGSNGRGPDGYYTQAVVRKAAACDQRGDWPVLTITSSTGQNLTIRW